MGHANRNTIAVSDESDVVLAGRRVRRFLRESGFDEPSIQDIVLVVHELASNIVKHAGSGSIDFSLASDDQQDAIEIRASDSGPGIADIDQAVEDGYSTVGGLGGGLGSVYRLMDDVVIHTNGSAKSGVKIVATRGTQSPIAEDRPPIEVDAATRPQPGYEQNGDAFLIEHGTNWTLVGVIDGLGHGQAAHRAASTARQYIQSNSSRSLEDLFAGVEEACRATRGVVLFLARFDWDERAVRLGSVGNITVKVCDVSKSHHLVPRRGVVGGHAPTPAIDRWELYPMPVMVVQTDGISSNWNCDDFDWYVETQGRSTAGRLLRQYAKSDDDATVLVIRGADS